MTTLMDRIMARVEYTEAGCWEWQGAKSAGGYGQIGVTANGVKRVAYTHRIALEHALSRPLAPGMQVDHLCRNRSCCNPAHLEEVTPRTNSLRGIGFAAVRSAQTECIHGHALTPDNTMTRANGTRNCRECHNARRRTAA